MSEQGYEEALAAARGAYVQEHAGEFAAKAARDQADRRWSEFLDWFQERAKGLGEAWPQLRLRVRAGRTEVVHAESIRGWGLPIVMSEYEYGEPAAARALLTEDLMLWPFDVTGVPEALVNDAVEAGPLRFPGDEPVISVPLWQVEDQDQRDTLREVMIAALAKHMDEGPV